MEARMDMRIVNNIIRVLRSCFFSWALYLLFIFFEGVVFQKGSEDPHPWIVHGENGLYVVIPFLVFFMAFLLFPLPKSRPYLWAVVRSIFMTAGIILCVTIAIFDYHPHYIHSKR
jgi:hypothetical protein